MLRLIILNFIIFASTLMADSFTAEEVAKTISNDLNDNSKYFKLHAMTNKGAKESLVKFLQYAYTVKGMDGAVTESSCMLIYGIYIKIGHERFFAAVSELPLNIQNRIKSDLKISAQSKK